MLEIIGIYFASRTIGEYPTKRWGSQDGKKQGV
jgi:hypothetical protein